MKKIIVHFLIFSIITITLFASCQKELSCAGCKDGNKPPMANAGPDQTIVLPKDSVLLDGSSSTDADGTIKSYKWIKIAGPVSFVIIKPDAPVTSVTSLIMGVYKFELTVTDNGGLSAKDTVQLMVDNPAVNQPPVACAGADQTITLPIITVTLDGSCSTDPDNNITGYVWSNISGPSSFNMATANAKQTQVINLVEGTYQFELKVTDAGGLFSKDTVQVSVKAAVTVVACDNSNRPQVNAQLIPVGTLSHTDNGVAVASAGNKILFAGGSYGPMVSSRVDILDITTNTWTTAELSKARGYMTTAVLGNKIFFAGGFDQTGFGSSRVDIYDVSTNLWTTTELSRGRYLMAGAAAGNKVLFAGGFQWANVTNDPYPTIVDIYDVSTNTWSVQPLGNRPPDASLGIAATVVGTKIYLAGAGNDWPGWDFGDISSTINIYDVSTNTWSISSLSEEKGFMAAIAVGNKTYWAGGKIWGQPSSEYLTNQVEIRDMNTGTSTFACLFQPNAGFFTSFDAVLKNNKIVFFTGAGAVINKFDIYNITTNTWSIGMLPVNIEGASIISVNNIIYVAGGKVNNVLSNQVYKLDF